MALNILLFSKSYPGSRVYAGQVSLFPFLCIFCYLWHSFLKNMCLTWSKSTKANSLKTFQTARLLRSRRQPRSCGTYLPGLTVLAEILAEEFLVSYNRNRHLHISILIPQRLVQLKSVISLVGGRSIEEKGMGGGR